MIFYGKFRELAGFCRDGSPRSFDPKPVIPLQRITRSNILNRKLGDFLVIYRRNSELKALKTVYVVKPRPRSAGYTGARLSIFLFLLAIRRFSGTILRSILYRRGAFPETFFPGSVGQSSSGVIFKDRNGGITFCSLVNIVVKNPAPRDGVCRKTDLRTDLVLL